MLRTNTFLRMWPGLLGCLMLSGCVLTKEKTVAKDESKPAPQVVTAAHVPPPESEGVQVAEVTHRLTVAEQERDALALRVEHLQALLTEKDRAMAAAGQELQAATAEVAQARTDLQKWKTEIDSLRERLRSSEKENAATLQSVIGLLEQMTQQGGNTEPKPKPPLKLDEHND